MITTAHETEPTSRSRLGDNIKALLDKLAIAVPKLKRPLSRHELPGVVEAIIGIGFLADFSAQCVFGLLAQRRLRRLCPTFGINGDFPDVDGLSRRAAKETVTKSKMYAKFSRHRRGRGGVTNAGDLVVP